VIGREQRELSQKKQEEIERETEDREKKAFIYKLRYDSQGLHIQM
jgi:restriction endonuclease S subunit